MKIAFLYNHDAPHQIAHTLPIALALSRRGVTIEALVSSDEQATAIRQLIGPEEMLAVRELHVGPVADAADRLLRYIAPFRRLAILRNNLESLSEFDAVVVPETTSTMLASRLKAKGVKLIYVPHGAGDTAVGFGKSVALFDLVLLSGEKIRDRMLRKGLIREGHYAVVGYPKFDLIDFSKKPSLFPNNRPTVLYNPHFNPALSSWFKQGNQILSWFAQQEDYNLIFAPHVMLAKRRLHTSLSHRRMGFRPDIKREFRDIPWILIDEGSQRSIDMTYTRAADIYIGEGSSQIYEWIREPRPAIFINHNRLRWQDDPGFAYWHLGQVINGAKSLPTALRAAVSEPNAYAERQRIAFQNTFSVGETTAGERAADAVLAYLNPA